MDITANKGLMSLLATEILDGVRTCEDIATLEHTALRQAHDALALATQTALETYDQELFADTQMRREHGLIACDKRRKTILSSMGQVSFMRRRYRRANTSCYLLDEVIDLPRQARLSPHATCQLACIANVSSYQAAADNLEQSSNHCVSRSTVKAALAVSAAQVKLCEEQSFPPTKREVKYLDVESDDVAVPLQRTRAEKKADRKAGKPAKKVHTQITLVKHYEDKELIPGSKHGRRRCVLPMHFVGAADAASVLKQASASIEQHYDITKMNCIHFGCDGAETQRAGAKILPGKVKLSYDTAHAFKHLWSYLDEEVYKKVKKGLYANDLKGVGQTLNNAWEYFCLTGQRDLAEKVAEAGIFILAHKDEILRGIRHSLGTLEGSNAHVIADRCKGRGRAWSIEGAENMVRLTALKASGKEIPYIGRQGGFSALAQAVKRRQEEATTGTSSTTVTEKVATRVTASPSGTPAYYHQVHLAPLRPQSAGHSWMHNLN
jgi:hypothetical protein